MSDPDLVTWLRAQLDDDEGWARAANRPYEYAEEGTTAPEGGVHWRWVTGDRWETVTPDPMLDEFVAPPGYSCWLVTVEEWPSGSDGHPMSRAYAAGIVEMDSAAAGHIIRHDPARVLRDVEAKREALTEHAPQLRTVEWDHDQNGKGEALCCPRCQNAEHSEWNPPLGQARGLPDGFVTPYVLAPCRTLRLLALPFADRPGYRAEWRP